MTSLSITQTNNNYKWRLLWFVYIGVLAMIFSEGEIWKYIFFLILGSVLAVLWQFIWRRISKWFKPHSDFCDLVFINRDKYGNVFHRQYLKESVSEDSYYMSVVTYANTPIKVEGLVIDFGVKQTYPHRIAEILRNRVRTKRIVACPSPNWWRDFRAPKLESQLNQPQIKRLVGIYFTDGKSSFPIIVDQSFVYDSKCHIVFDEPVEIPRGYPDSRSIQMMLELVNLNQWKGTLRLSSSVNGVNEYVLRKVNIKVRLKND